MGTQYVVKKKKRIKMKEGACILDPGQDTEGRSPWW